MKNLNVLKKLFFTINQRTIYFYSFLIGCATGIIALLFHSTIHHSKEFLFHHLAQSSMDDPQAALQYFVTYVRAWPQLWVLAIPAVGGLIVGLVVHFFAPEARGTGIDEFLDSFHNQGGHMRKRTPLFKFIASFFTISFGGSVGKEGPMALIGGGLGALYGKFLKVGARAQRTFLLAGAAGGLGAIFRAPLGGAITSVEVLYKEDFESDALLPCIISSVTAYTIYSSILGFGHSIRFSDNIFRSPVELFFYVFLAIFCSGAGFVFIRLFRSFGEKFFDKFRVHPILKPVLGGLMIGVIGLFFPHAIGEGLGVIQAVVDGRYPQAWYLGALFLFGLAILKMLTTSITIKSGASGGALVPSLFIGAMLGGFFGIICNHFFPQWAPSVSPFVIVGMAAFFSAVTNASLGALVMVTEMTGGYELLPPLMIVAVVSLILSHKFSLYKNQANNKFSSKAHLWDMNPKNLKHMQVREAFDGKYHHRAIILNDMPLSEIERLTQETRQSDFIVTDQSGFLVGFFSLKQFVNVEKEEGEEAPVSLIQDVMSPANVYVTEEDSLYQAMSGLMESEFDKIAVVNKEEMGLKVLGYLRHEDILQYYYKIGVEQAKKKEPDALEVGS